MPDARALTAALDELLELPRHALDELTAQDADERPADHHPEHPSEVDGHLVGRAGTALAEVLERPGALDRLQVAVLLDPADRGWRPVREPEPRLDPPHLRVGFRIDQDLRPGVAALNAARRLDLGLPPRGSLDVGRDIEHALDRRVDDLAGGAADRHSAEPSAIRGEAGKRDRLAGEAPGAPAACLDHGQVEARAWRSAALAAVPRLGSRRLAGAGAGGFQPRS